MGDCVLALLLGLAVPVSFYLNIGSVPLFDVDEGAFTEATREMFVRGDFISTYLNGEPRYDKPILIYWLQAVSVALFGLNEFAFRLPSSLAATAWALALLLFTRRMLGPRAALMATLIMVTSLQVALIGRAAIADALLNLWIAATMFSLYLWLEERQRRFLLLAVLFAALGFLTKGPIALLVPLATGLIYSATRGQLGLWPRAMLDPLAWLIFAGVALPWYLAQYFQEGDAFIQGFFLRHNLGRFSSPMEQHAGNLIYYVPVVLIGLLPYTSIVIAALADGLRRWREPLIRYLLIWFGFVFVFFSVSATKLPHYLVYGYSALFVLMAPHALAFRSRFWAFLPQLLLLLGLLVLPELVDWVVTAADDPHLAAVLADAGDYLTPGYRAIVGIGALVSVFFMVERRWSVAHKAAVSGIGLSFGLGALILPMIGALQQGPVVEAARIVRADPRPAVVWRLDAPSFSVYRERVTPRREPRPGELVLTKTIHLDDLAERGAMEVLYRKHGIALAALAALAGPRAP
jgi:4-amino-4-deoxy-L-arabinose transferase-like glycosyltransferase